MEHEFFDLGEETVVRCSAVSMSIILEGIIRCHGKIHDTHCMELDCDGKFRYARGQCAVLFRISLPVGKKELFESITGFNLTVPPKFGIN